MKSPRVSAPVVLALCLSASAAHGGSLAGVLQNNYLRRLELTPLAPALAATVASTYPVASSSSGVVYTFDPALGTFERQTGPAGPVFGERAETVGRGQFTVAASYSHVALTSINGDDLGDLENRPRIGNRVIIFPVKGGISLKDGRFSNYLPVHVLTDLNVEADIFAPSFTYGITSDFDVNLTLPLIHSSFNVTTNTQVPDPRLPQFALPAGDPHAAVASRSFSQSAVGVGDLLLRAKYAVHRERPVDVAAGLGLSLPTGNEDDFQGTGTTRIQPTLIVSRLIAGRFEPLLNLGIELNANDVDRSVFRWAAGGTALIGHNLTAALVFLGRDELAPQADKVPAPFFFQIERNDTFDASVGLRYRFAESGLVTANAVVPLNDDGLRPDVIPTIEVEWTFSGPSR